MQRGRFATVWWDTPALIRSALVVVLGGVALVGALLPWLILAAAWVQSGAPMGMDLPRALLMRDALVYGRLTSGPLVTPYAVAAALALVLLSLATAGHAGDADTGTGESAGREPTATEPEPAGRQTERPSLRDLGAATTAAVVAATLGLVVALVPLVLDLYAVVVAAEESFEGFFFAPDGLTSVIRLLSFVVEAAAWGVVLLLAVVQWRRAAFRLDGEPENAGETDDGPRPQRSATRQDAAHDAPDQAPGGTTTPGAGTARPIEPARLRPDGSSDSGFDEFHFRR